MRKILVEIDDVGYNAIKKVALFEQRSVRMQAGRMLKEVVMGLTPVINPVVHPVVSGITPEIEALITPPRFNTIEEQAAWYDARHSVVSKPSAPSHLAVVPADDEDVDDYPEPDDI